MQRKPCDLLAPKPRREHASTVAAKGTLKETALTPRKSELQKLTPMTT